MRKRSSLAGFALFLLTVVMVFALSIASTGAQDATPIPEPTAIVSDLGTGSMKISFWNGLTGSDGVTLNDMLSQFVTENPDIYVGHLFLYRFGVKKVDAVEFYVVTIEFKKK